MLASVIMDTQNAAVIAVWPTWRCAIGLVKETIMVPAAFAKMNINNSTQNTGVLTISPML